MHQALDQLADSDAANIPDDGIVNAVKDLLDVGDDLMRTEDPTGIWGHITNKDRIPHIVILLLKRLGATQCFDLLKDVYQTGRALSTIVEIVVRLGAQHGKYGATAWPEEERMVQSGELAMLEEVVAKKVIGAADDGSILNTPDFVDVLYRWQDWSGESLVNWLNEYLKTDDNFLFFLAKLIPDGEIHLGKNPISDLKQRRYASRVKDFVNIEEQVDRIQSLSTKR